MYSTQPTNHCILSRLIHDVLKDAVLVLLV